MKYLITIGSDETRKYFFGMTLTDWIGFIGVAMLLVAFFLNLRGVMAKDSVHYLLLNTIGAALACLASILLHYVPFIILEGCWTLVSLFGLIRVVKKPS